MREAFLIWYFPKRYFVSKVCHAILILTLIYCYLPCLSNLKLTPSKGTVPSGIEPETPRTPIPWSHKPRLWRCPGIRMCIGPVLMNYSDQFLHFLQKYFVRFSGVRVLILESPFIFLLFTCFTTLTLKKCVKCVYE